MPSGLSLWENWSNKKYSPVFVRGGEEDGHVYIQVV